MSFDKLDQTNNNKTALNESNFSVIRQIVSGTINTVSSNSIYGFTYLQIVQHAFLKYFHESSVQICNVFFLSPLVITEPEIEVQTVVKKEEEYLRFIVSSNFNPSKTESDKVSIKYVEGTAYRIIEKNVSKFSVEELLKRCCNNEPKIVPDVIVKANQSSELVNIEGLVIKPNEIFAEIKIPEKVIEETRGKAFHPAIFDWLLSVAIQCTGLEVFQPLFYKNLKLYGELVDNFYVYLRQKECSQFSDTTSYNIYFINKSEEIFLAIEDYIVSHKKDNKQLLQIHRQIKDTYLEPIESNFIKSRLNLNKKSYDANNIDFVNNLSWRQMDCYERCIALAIGGIKKEFVNYYKLFLGAKNGYNIKDFLLTNYCQNCLSKEMNIFDLFKVRMLVIKDNGLTSIHDTICKNIDIYGRIIISFDEYCIFYSPHYLNAHTQHVALITGYDKNKQRYSIIDHNQILGNNGAKNINYGSFFTTFDMVEKCYKNLQEEERIFLAFDLIEDGAIVTNTELKRILMDLLNYLIQTKQFGNDIEIIKDILEKKREMFDTSDINSLYYMLGGKELFIKTLLDYCIIQNLDKNSQTEMSNLIIQSSNNIINSYLASLYGRELKSKNMLHLVNELQIYSLKFFRDILSIIQFS